MSALQRQIKDLEDDLARANPKATMAKFTPTVKVYRTSFPNDVMALASRGLFATDIRVELGITEALWKEWKAEHEAFKVATERSRDLAQRFWNKTIRDAINNKDSAGINIANIIKIIELNNGPEEVDYGDASKLVKLDLTKGQENEGQRIEASIVKVDQ